jgi:uncharacterized protein (DUF1778 family)
MASNGKGTKKHPAGPGAPPKPAGTQKAHRVTYWLNDEQCRLIDEAARLEYDERNNFSRRMVLKAASEKLKAAAAAQAADGAAPSPDGKVG